MVSGDCNDMPEGESEGLRTKVGSQIEISIPERIQSKFQSHDGRWSLENINSTKEIERDAESMRLSSYTSSRSQSQELEFGKESSDGEREQNTSDRPDMESDSGEESEADGETSALNGDLPPISEHIDLKKLYCRIGRLFLGEGFSA
jgi:hypothetical protein